MTILDLLNTASTLVGLVKDASELMHTDKMPDMLFLFGLVVNPVKDKDKKK